MAKATVREILGDDLDTLKAAGLPAEKIVSIAKTKAKYLRELRTVAKYDQVDDEGNIKEKSFDDVADYITQKKIHKDDKPKPVKTLDGKEAFKEDLKDDNFLTRGLKSMADNYLLMGAAGLNKAGIVGDDTLKTMRSSVQANEEYSDEINAAKRSPIREEEVKRLEAQIGAAKGIGEKAKATAKLMLDKITHPGEIDPAAAVAMAIDPLNLVAPEAAVIARSAKLGKAAKAGIGAVAGGVAQGGVAGGDAYLLSKAKGESDEQAKEAGLVGGVLGAGMGAGLGAVSGAFARSAKPIIKEKIKAKNQNDPVADAMGNPSTEDSGLKIDEKAIDELLDNELLQLDEVESHSVAAKPVIEQIATQAQTPEQINAMVAQYVPPSPKEQAFSLVLNDNKPVSPRFAGVRLRDALVKSIENPRRSPEELYGVLVSEGVTPEHAAAATEAYKSGDVTLYDNYTTDKLSDIIDTEVIEKTKRLEMRDDRAAADSENGKRDAGQPEIGNDANTPATGKENGADTEPTAVPADQRGGDEALPDTGQRTGKSGQDTGVSGEPEGVERHQTAGSDGADVPGTPGDAVVQNENVVHTGGGLEELSKHPKFEEHLKDRENVKAEDIKYAKKQAAKGTLSPEGDYIAPVFDKNWLADFELTKKDVADIRSGKASDAQIEKLKNDLGRYDNDPAYYEHEATVKQKVDALPDNPEEIKFDDEDWNWFEEDAPVPEDLLKEADKTEVAPKTETKTTDSVVEAPKTKGERRAINQKVTDADRAVLNGEKAEIDAMLNGDAPVNKKRLWELSEKHYPKESAFAKRVVKEGKAAQRRVYSQMRAGKVINPFHKDVIAIARTHIMKGITAPGKFARVMKKSLGKAWKVVRPHIKKIFEKAFDQVEQWAQKNGHRGQIVRSIIGRSYAVADDGVPKAKMHEAPAPEARTLQPETKLQRLRRTLQDKFIRVKELQDVKTGGKETPDSINVYQAEELYHGRAAAKIEVLNEKIIQPMLKYIAKSPYELKDVDLYLHARHAKERNAKMMEVSGKENGSGMSDAEAEKILEKYDTPQMREIANYVDAMTEARLKIIEAEGLESKEYVDMLRSNYKHYVPLQRVMDEGGHSGGNLGRGFDVKGKEFKRARGSDRAVESPLANTIKGFEETVVRAEKNRVGKTFLKFAEAYPDDTLYTVESLKYMPRYDKNGEIISIDPQYQLKDNVMHVKVDGKIKQVTFHDPALAAAFKNLTPTKMNILTKLSAKMVRYFAAINTQYNPEFIISNFLRDIQAAALNLPEKVEVNRAKFVKEVGGAIKDINRGLIKNRESEWFKLFEEMRKEGGTTGWMEQYSAEEGIKSLKKELAMLKGEKLAASTIRAIGKYIDDTNTAVENGVRLVAYKYAKESGLSKAQAASIAKNLTVNFNRKGEAGTLINSLYMFYNASAQGTMRLAQALKESNKARAGAVALVGIGVGLDIYNRSVNEDKYRLIPRFVKDTNLIIMNEDGTYFKVPLPYGWNIFKSIGDAASEAFYEQKVQKPFGRLLSASVSAFSPIGVDSEDVMHTITPTVLKPVYEVTNNVNFMGKKYMPDNPYSDKVDSHTYFKSVNPQFKDTAIWLNKVTGGTTYTAGAIDISPETMEHVAGWVTGGLGKTLINSATTITNALRGEATSPRKVPFLRKLYSELNPKSEYYAALDIYTAAKDEKKIVDPGDREVFYKLMDDALEYKEIDEDKHKNLLNKFARNQAKKEWAKKFDVSSDSNIEDLEPRLKIEYYKMILKYQKDPRNQFTPRQIKYTKRMLKNARSEL